MRYSSPLRRSVCCPCRRIFPSFHSVIATDRIAVDREPGEISFGRYRRGGSKTWLDALLLSPVHSAGLLCDVIHDGFGVEFLLCCHRGEARTHILSRQTVGH